MSYFKEGDTYLVYLKNSHIPRIATFMGEGRAWGGNSWRGDTGFSTDSWQQEDLEFALPFSKLHFNVDGDNKTVKSIFYDNTKE